MNYYYHYSLSLTQNGQVNTVETVATSGIVTVDPVNGISAPSSINISTSTVWAGTTVNAGSSTGGGSSPCSIRHSTLNDNGIGFTVVCPFLSHTDKSAVSGKSGDCPDGGGGVGISPLLAKKTLWKVNVELGLTAEEFDWLAANLNTALPIRDFLERGGYSEEAKNEAKMRVSFGISLSQNGLKPASGKLGGLDALEYTHMDTGYDGGKGTLYKLKSGLFISSYNSRRRINKSDEFNSEPSLSFDGNFYYANDGDTDKWYEVLISKGVGSAPNGEHVLIDAFWTGARFVGRYALPVEDAMILVDGKDWDGVEQSRVRTAGFLLVGFVPGGKAMQPVAKITSGITKYKKVIKIGTKTINLPLNIVNNVVDFGPRNSYKFRQTVGLAVGDLRQAHHLLSRNLMNHRAIQKVANSDKIFHIDEALNGMPIAAWRNQPNHNIYDNNIKNLLDKIPKNLNENETFDRIKSIIDNVRTTIENNPSKHLNNLTF